MYSAGPRVPSRPAPRPSLHSPWLSVDRDSTSPSPSSTRAPIATSTKGASANRKPLRRILDVFWFVVVVVVVIIVVIVVRLVGKLD